MSPATIGLLIGLTFGAIFTACSYIIGRSDGYKMGTLRAWQDYKGVLINVKANIDKLAQDIDSGSFFEADKTTH